MAEEPREVIVEHEREPRSHVGTIVAVVIGVILLILVLMYGLPALMGSNNSTTNVNVPTPTTTDTATGN